MKKQICLTLVLALLLCGCSGGSEPQTGKVVPRETEAAVTQPAEPERSASLGRLEGGEYINEYVGYGCTLGSSWTFYSAEELQELPENVAELMEGTQVGDTAAQLTQISDMMAENAGDLTTVNVLYTRLSLQERLAYEVLEEKTILEQVLSQKDALISSYAQAGIDVSEMELVQISFLGESRWAVHTTAAMQGVPYFVLQVYDYHLGEYGVVTTFASFVEDRTGALPELFYPLD